MIQVLNCAFGDRRIGRKMENLLLCYDYHDIWAISPDGKQRKRLTNGKEKDLRFRFDASAVSNIERV